MAGVAALIKSVKPSMSPDAVAAALQDTAGTVDCAPAGPLPDLDCGFGFPLADVQVQELDRTPPSVTNVLAPAAPDGRNGFYTAPVAVSWNLGDAGSPIYGSTGCAPVTVTADGPTTLTCEARSLGGTFRRSVTFNRDGSPPSAPAIAGIAARSYKRGKVPSAISCTLGRPDVGRELRGHRPQHRARPHTLTATATNGAGLTSSSQLAYSVAAARVTKVSRRGALLPLHRRCSRSRDDHAGPEEGQEVQAGQAAEGHRQGGQERREAAEAAARHLPRDGAPRRRQGKHEDVQNGLAPPTEYPPDPPTGG